MEGYDQIQAPLFENQLGITFFNVGNMNRWAKYKAAKFLSVGVNFNVLIISYDYKDEYPMDCLISDQCLFYTNLNNIYLVMW